MRILLSCLLLTAALAAEEIPASQVAKVSHGEGFSVKTSGHQASIAVVTLKGADKPEFMLVVEGAEGLHYFRPEKGASGIHTGIGKDLKYVLDENKKTLTIVRGKVQKVEKFQTLSDS